MIRSIEKIYEVSHELNMISSKLPTVAKKQFLNECLIEELYHTNELEGVQSTKKEIAESVKHVELKTLKKKRFKSMIHSYLNLYYGENVLPTKPVDIRNIYDQITEGEIEKSELPDGKIFRKEETNVLHKSGSGKVIHRGIMPEEKIISEIEKLLYLMNDLEEVPLLIRIAVGHYYFGYIHPFYDGNAPSRPQLKNA